MNSRTYRAYLAGVSLLVIVTLFACNKANNALPAPPKIPTNAIVRENQGSICFETIQGTTILEASISSGDCLPSNCTLTVQEVGSVNIDKDLYELKFQSRFIMIDPYWPKEHSCFADCGGGGRVTLNIGSVEKGIYSVWLGDTKLGEILIPLSPARNGSICLTSKATGTPVSSPQPTLTPSPPVAYPILPEPSSTPQGNQYP